VRGNHWVMAAEAAEKGPQHTGYLQGHSCPRWGKEGVQAYQVHPPSTLLRNAVGADRPRMNTKAYRNIDEKPPDGPSDPKLLPGLVPKRLVHHWSSPECEVGVALVTVRTRTKGALSTRTSGHPKVVHEGTEARGEPPCAGCAAARAARLVGTDHRLPPDNALPPDRA
jgi:hypothetical protein